MNSFIKVLLAHKSPLLCSGVTAMLRDTNELHLVGQISRRRDIVTSIARLRPDILLLDPRLLSYDKRELWSAVAADYPQTKIVLFGDRPHDSKAFYWLLDQGIIAGCVADIEEPVVLQEAIHTVATGQTYFSQLAKSWLAGSLDTDTNVSLTRRERTVLSLIGQGLTNGEIAGKLGIKQRTVEFHITNILKKLQVSSRIEAALWAANHHLANDVLPSQQ